ncbi:hypothetical protein WISP_05791 [Willisornis vidua]|uniref:Uncharacterized protein n=1 Tax=Willisornis vidua TaxID=1566151 RepID=A0ABQ9DY89_9PASS|nr:hypothetical protein WISP_05791 [Willisornis vidua]
MVEPNPKVSPTGTDPKVSPTGTIPEVSPTGTNPKVSPIGTIPKVFPTGTDSKVSPTGTDPKVSPTGTIPEVSPTGIHPKVSPTGGTDPTLPDVPGAASKPWPIRNTLARGVFFTPHWPPGSMSPRGVPKLPKNLRRWESTGSPSNMELLLGSKVTQEAKRNIWRWR